MEISPGHIHCVKWFESGTLGEIGEVIKKKLEITFRNDRKFPNGKKAPDGIEIRFGNTRPTEQVRELLKAHGFRFSEKQTIWYAFDNKKSRELIEQLEDTEVEVDTTQYEKRSFWKKVKSAKEFNELKPYTEFMVTGQPPKFFFNKKALLKSNSNTNSLIYKTGLSFKKYYNKIVGEDEAENEEGEEREQGENEGGGEREEKNNGIEIAEKLQALAEGMQKTIDAKINSPTSKQRPTAKRARVAAGMREDAYRFQDVQSFLFALAKAHRDGSIYKYPLLKNIRGKSQIDKFNYYGHAIKQNWNKNNIQLSFDTDKDTLNKLGIHSVYEWSLADNQKNELLQTLPVKKENVNERKIKELEMELLSKKIPGFFPTPPDLIERLIELADLREDESILEPSAGKGDILDAIRKKFEGKELDLSAIEIYAPLREIIELKGYELIAGDFLDYEVEKFNKIIMNPPFENGQDIDHVMHALSLLTKGGRVVAIMGEGVFFREFKKDRAFRELLAEKNAYTSERINEAFKMGFKSTGVAVRIVVINEDGSPISFKNNNTRSENKKSAEASEEEMELDELEAQAQLELLRLRVEQKKRQKNNLKGVDYIDPEKLQGFRQKAWALQGYEDVLNFK